MTVALSVSSANNYINVWGMKGLCGKLKSNFLTWWIYFPLSVSELVPDAPFFGCSIRRGLGGLKWLPPVVQAWQSRMSAKAGVTAMLESAF